MSSGAVSLVLSGQRNPGTEFCLSIAKALHLPPEPIFRKAGLLPTITETEEENSQLIEYFQYLDEADRQRLLAIARTLYEHRTEYHTKGDQ